MSKISPIGHADILEGPTSRRVAALAAEHGITYVRTALDEYADAITRLAGDEVHLDATENLLVALGRKKVIDGGEMIRMMDAHRNETNAL